MGHHGRYFRKGHHGGHHGGHHDERYSFLEQFRDARQPPAAEPATATMLCPKCRAENPATAKFCVDCGENIRPVPTACGSCGKAVPAGSRFCPDCGTMM